MEAEEPGKSKLMSIVALEYLCANEESELPYLCRNTSVSVRPCLERRRETTVGLAPDTAFTPLLTASSPLTLSTPTTPKKRSWQAAPCERRWAVVDWAWEVGSTVSPDGRARVVGSASGSTECAYTNADSEPGKEYFTLVLTREHRKGYKCTFRTFVLPYNFRNFRVTYLGIHLIL